MTSTDAWDNKLEKIFESFMILLKAEDEHQTDQLEEHGVGGQWTEQGISAQVTDRHQVEMISAHSRANTGSPERKTQMSSHCVKLKSIHHFKAFDVIRKPRCG